MKFFKVASFDEAKKTITENFDIKQIKSQYLPLDLAVGYRVFSDIKSSETVPEFNRSTVDGYAVKASNTYGATDSVPSMLKVLGSVEMGIVGKFNISLGESVYVPTGGEVPNGADAMVMIEYTEVFGDNIAVYKPVVVADNIIKIGDDIEKGDIILKRGETLTPLKAGVLASLGISKVEVFKKIKVAIISTGDEIVGVDEKTQIGQIRDSNSTINSALCEENNFEVVSIVRIKDDFDILDRAVLNAVDVADIVLISGGSSIGCRDFTEQVLEKEGEILIHGIAIKPGKPTLISKVLDKLVFGLPGHPMACLLTLKLLVLKTLNEAFSKQEERFVFAVTDINFPSAPGRLTIQPVSLKFSDDKIIATPLFYKSGLVSVLADADGYILIPENQEGVYKGQSIKVYLL